MEQTKQRQALKTELDLMKTQVEAVKKIRQLLEEECRHLQLGSRGVTSLLFQTCQGRKGNHPVVVIDSSEK